MRSDCRADGNGVLEATIERPGSDARGERDDQRHAPNPAKINIAAAAAPNMLVIRCVDNATGAGWWMARMTRW